MSIKENLKGAALIANSVIILFGLPLTSHAQESGDVSAEAAEKAWIEKISVTAQKRPQSTLDVGISVAAVDREAIKESRISEVTDIVLFTSNTSIKDTVPGLMPVITIRGVGLNDYNAANNPSAGVYIDDVSLSSLALMSSDIIDLERVEVLKGPQGTLYGRNSTAGAIRFNTAKPNFKGFSSLVSVGAGNYGMGEMEAMVNTSVNDNLAFRFAGKLYNKSEGFWRNRVTDSNVGETDELTARIQALWEPDGDETRILMKIEGHQGRSELGTGEYFGLAPSSEGAMCPGSPECLNFVGYADVDEDPFVGDWSVDPSYKKDQFSATLKIEREFDIGTLVSISGFIDFDREYSADVDASPLPLTDFRLKDEVKQFSEELRLMGSTDLMEWQAGLFYAVDKVDARNEGLLGLFNTASLTVSSQESRSKALFSNIDWKLNDDLTLITGLRFSQETKHNQTTTQDLIALEPGSLLTQAPFGTPPITLASGDNEIDDSSVAWKLGLNWRLDRESLLYTSLAQGNKSGGFFSGIATSSLQYEHYDSETLRSFEVGYKHISRASGVNLDINGFYYDYNDIQMFIQDNSGDIPVQRLNNVEGATIYGLDMSIAYMPITLSGLTLNANMGYLNTELEPFVGAFGPVAKGQKLPDSPEFSIQLAAHYEVDLTDTTYVKFSMDSRYQSETYRDVLNDSLLESNGYWVANARATVYFDNDIELALWVKNLTDEQYVTQGFNQLPLGNGYRVYGSPRTYGITFSMAFD